MKIQTSEKRLIFFLVPLLVAFQVAAFVSMRYANRSIAMDTLDNELGSGAQVFQFALAQRTQYLSQATDLVAKDFGFREAVTNSHRATVESALKNQMLRMGANLVVLADLQGEVVARSASDRSLEPADFGELRQDVLAARVGEGDTRRPKLLPLRVDDQRSMLYQWIQATVRTPMPSARLVLAFEIDDAAAVQLKQMTNLDFVFMSRHDGGWRVHASSLDPQVQATTHTQIEQAPEGFWTLRAQDENYRMLTLNLGGAADPTAVVALVGKSFQPVMGPFSQLERLTGTFVLLSALLSVFAVYRVTHRIVAPLETVVFQDGLTQLANRRLFELNLHTAAQNLKTLGRGYCVMVMDLNKFKAVNDTLGHAAGDQVLQVAAKRIHHSIRNSDTVARLGGDEFALLLITDDRQRAREIAAQIVESVRRPIGLAGGTRVDVGVSIGIAMAPHDSRVNETLLQLADEAMYAAKQGGTGFAFAREEAAQPEAAAVSEPAV
ncbi:diguanylate cyclase domain-containing protein [Sphingomonas sp. NCPPB 2930]